MVSYIEMKITQIWMMVHKTMFCAIHIWIILNVLLCTIHVWMIMHAFSQTGHFYAIQHVLYGPNLNDSECAFVRQDSKSST